MASALTDLLIARAQAIIAELNAMTLGSGKPGSAPNVRGGNGHDTIDHQGYRKLLNEELLGILRELRLDGVSLDTAGNVVNTYGIASTQAIPI